MVLPEPQVGETVFLVHGRCFGGCGVWMALPEGARWPDCPECGAPVRPTAWKSTEPGDWRDRDDPECRGYVAHHMQEFGAVDQVLALRVAA